MNYDDKNCHQQKILCYWAGHWNFKGTHTGVSFGIPATNNKVDIDVVTLVRMESGKIGEEMDFLDNL